MKNTNVITYKRTADVVSDYYASRTKRHRYLSSNTSSNQYHSPTACLDYCYGLTSSEMEYYRWN